MSVRGRGGSGGGKNRKQEYTSLKSLGGVKPVDDTFKAASAPLRECAELRDSVQVL